MTWMNLSCDRVEALLPDYLEGEMEARLRTSLQAHVADCPRCSGLIEGVESIVAGARTLPELVPPRDLWGGIEHSIRAPVLALAPDRHKRLVVLPVRAAAAAAALVIATASITYLMTVRISTAHVASTASTQAPAQAELPNPSSAGVLDSGSVATGAPVSASNPSERESPIRARVQVRVAGAATGDSRPARTITQYAGNSAELPQTDAAYSGEIALLQKMVSSRMSLLDPVTVQVIEKNLRVIDEAIQQSRSALAKDPASSLLYDQLNRVLDKKVELLRTAVQLPSST